MGFSPLAAALVSIPQTIQYDGTTATLSDADKLRIENLLESANQCKLKLNAIWASFHTLSWLTTMPASSYLFCLSLSLAGVSSQCLNEGNNYGYTVGQPCILVHITRVCLPHYEKFLSVISSDKYVNQWHFMHLLPFKHNGQLLPSATSKMKTQDEEQHVASASQ